MKTKLLTILGLILLFSLSLDAAGLTQVTTSATDFKNTLFTLAKVIAAIGLLFIVIRYFMQQSEQRSMPWGWVIAAIILGAIEEILTMFGIN
jgi:RsiW-degrading membrane proteinase PrsW (M82 family)